MEDMSRVYERPNCWSSPTPIHKNPSTPKLLLEVTGGHDIC